LPPVQLDDDEATAVVVSLRSATSHTVTGLAEASVRALVKLDQVLPVRLTDECVIPVLLVLVGEAAR